MRARKDIVLALRCSATYGEAVDCTGCPYLLEASVEGESWLSCDVDQIALDAAEMLRQDGEEAGRLMSNGDRIRRMSDETASGASSGRAARIARLSGSAARRRRGARNEA